METQEHLPFYCDSEAVYYFDVIEEALNLFLSDRNKMIPAGKMLPFILSRRFQSFIHTKLHTADLYKLTSGFGKDFYFLIKSVILSTLKELFQEPEDFHNFIVANEAPTDRPVLFFWFEPPHTRPYVTKINYVYLTPDRVDEYKNSKLVQTGFVPGKYHPAETRSMFLYERRNKFESDQRKGDGTQAK